MEEKREEKGFSYALLHERARTKKKHKRYNIYITGGFLYFNMRVIPNRFRRVSDKNPSVGEPHVESNITFEGSDYVRYRRTDGAEGGYQIFGLTREKAFELLMSVDLENVNALLEPAIQEALLSIEFFNYLVENSYIKAGMPFENIEKNMRQYVHNPEIIKAYILYDIRDGRRNEGWAHKAVLKTLAHLLNVDLQLWVIDDRGMMIQEKERRKEKREAVNSSFTEQPTPKRRKKRINLFFLENNHFDQIEFLNMGWKIHVSLAEDGDNIEKAWNLIVDVLQVYGVRSCKVLAAGKHLPVYQWGKEITLYVPHEVIHWQSLLDEITKRFVENGIRPNCLAFKDKAVDGSSFFGCRNDESSEGRYVNGYEAKDFNPSDQPVPSELKSLKIVCAGQESRKSRKNELLLEAFYKKLHNTYKEAAKDLITRLISCSPKFKKTNPNTSIWSMETEALEVFFSAFDDEVRPTIIGEVEKIKQIQQLEFGDFDHLSEDELCRVEEQYTQRLVEVKVVVNGIVELVTEKLMEAYAKGTPSNSSSSEGSPRNEDNQGGTPLAHPQGK